MQLSDHFTSAEMTASATAKARGLDNQPNAMQTRALILLCQRVLEPVRLKFGPVRVTSGFRCFTPDSQHGRGEAADFEVAGIDNLIVARWIVAHVPFDQIILENASAHDPNAGWIHCSYRDGRLRKSVLTMKYGAGGRPVYTSGLKI